MMLLNRNINIYKSKLLNLDGKNTFLITLDDENLNDIQNTDNFQLISNKMFNKICNYEKDKILFSTKFARTIT